MGGVGVAGPTRPKIGSREFRHVMVQSEAAHMPRLHGDSGHAVHGDVQSWQPGSGAGSLSWWSVHVESTERSAVPSLAGHDYCQAGAEPAEQRLCMDSLAAAARPSARATGRTHLALHLQRQPGGRAAAARRVGGRCHQGLDRGVCVGVCV